MQNHVNLTRAIGKSGTISRQNPLTSLPFITEDDKIKCGSFAFVGSKREKLILGIKPDATKNDIQGFVVHGYQINTTFGNSTTIIKNSEVQVVKKGYCFATSSTDAVSGDFVHVNPTNGVILTSHEKTVSNFINTGWIVETGGTAGDVIEIFNI